MSGFKYTAKIEKEGFKEILIDSGSVATLGDFKREICKRSTVKLEAIHIWAGGEKITNYPDSTILQTLRLTASDNIIVREIRESIEQEQGRVNIVQQLKPNSFPLNPNNKQLQRTTGTPIQSLDINQKQHQKKELKDNDDDELMKDPALMTLEDKLNYRPKMKPRPDPKWPELAERPLKERRQDAIQALAKKLKEQGWENAYEWAQMGHGRQMQIKTFREIHCGHLIKKQICGFVEKHSIRRIIKHYMNCKPIKRHRQALLTTYGLIDFVFGKATEYYPALDLMQQDRKKMFYEIAGVEWFHSEPIVPNKKEDQAYIKDLTALTDQSIVTQLQRITKDKQKAVKLVEMSQNDLETALRIFEKGEGVAREGHLLKIEERQQKDLGMIAQWQQQPYLFVWLMNNQNYLLRLRFFADPAFLQVFTLSMKHLCPALFKLLVKHRSYILKIMKICPLRLYHQEPEF